MAEENNQVTPPPADNGVLGTIVGGISALFGSTAAAQTIKGINGNKEQDYMSFDNLHITRNGDKITLGVSSGVPTDGNITELEKDNTNDSLWQKFVTLKETIATNALQVNELKEIIDNRSWNKELYKKQEAVVESVQLGENGVHKDSIKLDKYEDGVVRATFIKSGEILVFAEFDAEQGDKIFEKYKKVQSSIDESKQFLKDIREEVNQSGTSRWWTIEKKKPKKNLPEQEQAKPEIPNQSDPKKTPLEKGNVTDIEYKKAIGTLKEFMADKTLDSEETPDLKTLTNGEKQTEYTTIAKHHQKLAEEALEKGDDKAFEKHSAIANLAGIINKKIEDNTLADGELTKLTDKLLNKIDEKQLSPELAIDDIIKKLKPDHREQPYPFNLEKLDEIKNPKRLDYTLEDRITDLNNKYNPKDMLARPTDKYEILQAIAAKMPSLGEENRDLTQKLLSQAQSNTQAPATLVSKAVGKGEGLG
jgi:hypothetical protein